MSGEQLTAKELNETTEVKSLNRNPTLKVNIVNLLSRARQEKEKEKIENYIFLGIICVVITVTGVIASF